MLKFRTASPIQSIDINIRHFKIILRVGRLNHFKTLVASKMFLLYEVKYDLTHYAQTLAS